MDGYNNKMYSVKSAKIYFYILCLVCLLLYPIFSIAKIIGAPPYKSIDIPASIESSHYDMVVDSDNTLYVSYMDGVKIFNGNQWQNIEILKNTFVRKLFIDNGRIYVGGFQLLGYIEKDNFGTFKFTNLTPKNNDFESIWNIIKCNNQIYFRSVKKLFEYNTSKNSVKSWSFESKLGALLCHNKQVTIQDRSIGFKKLVNNQWQTSKIQIPENPFVYELTLIAENTYFVLSNKDEWQLVKDNKIIPLNFDKQLPQLGNYVSNASLSNGKLVLGSNNGLLTFVDTNSQTAESFQLTNEWIAKIIVTKHNEIIVLTEFEVFYLQWPSQLRVQGKETGLSSDILSVNEWNNSTYVSSSSGVFVEDKEQIVYQHKLFKRLNWTNQEAWWLLPINNNTALLAESHRLFRIDQAHNTQAISDIIYPRELYQSNFNSNYIYVITEFELHLFTQNSDNSWQSKIIYDQRPASIVEIAANELLISTEEDGIFKIKLNPQADEITIKQMNEKLGISIKDSNSISFTKLLNGVIYAFNSNEIYYIKNNKLIRDSLDGLDEILGTESLNGLKQNFDGVLYAYTNTNFIYQNEQKIWAKMSLSPYIKGTITDLYFIDDEIKIASYATLINYLNIPILKTAKEEHKLDFTSIEFSNDNTKKLLPLNLNKIFYYDQDSGKLSFDFALSDIKNYKETLYRYRITGFNDKWSDYNNITSVNLGKLTSGTYSFEVQAKNNLNQIYTIKPYHFVINPPWYLTTMAIFLWVILGVFTLLVLWFLTLKWRERIHEVQKKQLKNIINHKTQELKRANKKLKIMAHHDGLTGLYNRLFLDEFIKSIVESDINSLSVLMLDMDHFKIYNDTYGHLAGDELLKKLALVITQEIKQDDHCVVARYGGEEFVVILLNKTQEFVMEKAEKIRQAIEIKSQKVSASIGISFSTDQVEIKSFDGIYQLIDSADQLLYQAKDNGRNKICCH